MKANPFRFRPARDDYQPGDERTYHVSHRGITIGIVEQTWAPSRFVDGEPVQVWGFESFDRTLSGEGRTRAAAVTAALVAGGWGQSKA